MGLFIRQKCVNFLPVWQQTTNNYRLLIWQCRFYADMKAVQQAGYIFDKTKKNKKKLKEIY